MSSGQKVLYVCKELKAGIFKVGLRDLGTYHQYKCIQRRLQEVIKDYGPDSAPLKPMEPLPLPSMGAELAPNIATSFYRLSLPITQSHLQGYDILGFVCFGVGLFCWSVFCFDWLKSFFLIITENKSPASQTHWKRRCFLHTADTLGDASAI